MCILGCTFHCKIQCTHVSSNSCVICPFPCDFIATLRKEVTFLKFIIDFSQNLRNSLGWGGLLTEIGGFQEVCFPQKSLFIQQKQAQAQSPAPPREGGFQKSFQCPFRALSRARIRAAGCGPLGLWDLVLVHLRNPGRAPPGRQRLWARNSRQRRWSAGRSRIGSAGFAIYLPAACKAQSVRDSAGRSCSEEDEIPRRNHLLLHLPHSQQHLAGK